MNKQHAIISLVLLIGTFAFFIFQLENTDVDIWQVSPESEYVLGKI